LTQGAQICCY